MTILLRAVLALALLAGLYLLALVLVLVVPGLVAIVIAGVTVPESSPWHVSGWSLPGYLLLLVATLTLDWAILRGVFARRPADSRTRVPVPDGSELRQMVDGLAKRIGTRPPTYLYLYINAKDAKDVNAEVRENARYLGLIGGTRTMDIGLPLLAALSPDQLQAVLGHELGHYNRSDTRLGPLTYRGHITIQATLTRLSQISVSRRPLGVQLLTTASIWLFALYVRLYLRISTAVARRQEVRADAQAAQTVQATLQQREADPAGLRHLTQQPAHAKAREAAAKVTAQALLLVHAVPEAWQDFLRRCPTMPQLGRHPDQLFIAFQHMVTDIGYQQHLRWFQQSALERQAKKFDTHPSLNDRIRRLDPDLDPTDCISRGGKNPLLGKLQHHLELVAQDIYRTATTSAATAKIPDTGSPERPGGVVRIDPDDEISEFWQQIQVLAILVAVISILTIVVWLWHAASSGPAPP